MIAQGRRLLGSLAMAFAAAASLTVAVSAGSAYAIDHVECVGGEDFLKIYSHLDGRNSVDCYANAGAGPTSAAGGPTGSSRATTT
ncbi:hypothetical protein K388_07047 [Streptomyces sp. KhCrAH-43]|nr:hypothetical protein K388_07047 [Streptomyces sp. KhCrAH-43]